jgi:hypothetical protein
MTIRVVIAASRRGDTVAALFISPKVAPDDDDNRRVIAAMRYLES